MGNEAGFNKHGARKKIKGDAEAEAESSDDEGDNELTNSTPFTQKTQQKSRQNMLQTPCGGGQFGRRKPQNMLTQQREARYGEGKTKEKNFLVAYSKSKSGIEKFEFPIITASSRATPTRCAERR